MGQGLLQCGPDGEATSFPGPHGQKRGTRRVASCGSIGVSLGPFFVSFDGTDLAVLVCLISFGDGFHTQRMEPISGGLV